MGKSSSEILDKNTNRLKMALQQYFDGVRDGTWPQGQQIRPEKVGADDSQIFVTILDKGGETTLLVLSTVLEYTLSINEVDQLSDEIQAPKVLKYEVRKYEPTPFD